MKTKFLLSVATLALFAACNDSSSSPTAADQTPSDTPSVNTPAADSVQTNIPTPDTTAQDGLEQGPNVVDSIQADKPVDTPKDPATTDTVAPVPADTISQAPADTTVPPPADTAVTTPPKEKVSYVYYGAELSGKEKFKYGRFEARMKMVSIPGSVSSMFLYYDESYLYGDEPWNEIDIEVIGTSKEKWQSNIITREGAESIGKKQTTSEDKHDFGFDATEDFHLYAMIWTPEYVAWEIDSVEVRRDTLGMKYGAHADSDQVAFLTEEQTLRFNLWVSSSTAWVGKFTGDELADGPQVQWIDYVRVYAYDEATKGFTLSWQDDFEGETLSSERWSKGNWEMDLVEYKRKNIVVEDGYCKLMLSREEE